MSSESKKAAKVAEAKADIRSWYLPEHGVTIEAPTLAEAVAEFEKRQEGRK